MRASIVQHITWLIFEPIIHLFFGYRVEWATDWDPRTLEGPIIIVSNHRSYFDHFFVTGFIPFLSRVWPINFLVARLFFKWWNPISWILWNGGCIPVERTVPGKTTLEDVLRGAEATLKRGSVLLIFPEGHRAKESAIPQRAGRGTAYLALKLGVPILPVFIRGNERLSWGKVFTGRARVTLRVGSPAYLSGDYKTDVGLEAATGQVVKYIGDLA